MKDRLDGEDEEAPATASAVSTTPSGGAVTPAGVAESMNDPDRAHPEPPEPESRGSD